MFKTSLLVVLAVATLSPAIQVPFTPLSVPPQSPPIPHHQFAAFLEEIRANGSIPGISVGVVRLGNTSGYLSQFVSSGFKTEGATKEDMTADTLFALASCSKAYAATAMGLLIDDFAHGRNVVPLPSRISTFDWDTKVADLLPDDLGWSIKALGGDDWAAKKANIRDILGHVSGLPGHDFSYVVGDTAADVVRRMGNLSSAYELREKWSYNNQMYTLASHIISHYSGTPFIKFVRERIFVPAGMRATTYRPSEAQRTGKLSHAWDKSGRCIPYWASDSVSEHLAGAGGIVSSSFDVTLWLSLWLNKGKHPVLGKQVFSEGVYDALTTAHHVVYGRPIKGYGDAGIVGYGMGWTRWSYGNIDVVQHNGGVPGFSTVTAFSPKHNIGVVVLSNADEKGWWNQLVLMKALDLVLGAQGVNVGPSAFGTDSFVPEGFAPIVHDSSAPRHQRLTGGRLTDPPLTLPIGAYTGTYVAPGYPNITLCAYYEPNTSAYCLGVLRDFAIVDGAAPLPTSPARPAATTASTNTSALPQRVPQLFGASPSVWASHVRLRHGTGDAFALTFEQLHTEGFGRDRTPFATYEAAFQEGRALFSVVPDKRGRPASVVEGFGLVMDEEAYAARRRRIGVSAALREVVDAWYEKME